MTSGASSHTADHPSQLEAAQALFAALRAHAPAYQERNVLCAVHGLLPVTLSGGITLLAVALFWLPQPVGAAAAALLMLAGAIAFALELLGHDNPLRWMLPEQESTLAHACWREASSPATIIVAAALRAFASPPVPLPAWRWALWLSLGAQLVLFALFAGGIIAPERALRTAALGVAVIPALTGALAGVSAWQTQRASQHTTTAAAEVLIALARQLAAEPPQRHAVCLVLSSAPACLLADVLAPEVSAVHAQLLLLEPSEASAPALTVATQTGWLRAQLSDLTLLTLARRVAESEPALALRFAPLPLPSVPSNSLAIQVSAPDAAASSSPALIFTQRMVQALDAMSNG